jgi:putative NADPH-quinone reductase
MITIIFAHPKHESLNGSIFHAVEKCCEESGKSFTSIDLYKDGFSPLLTAEELDGFYNGIAMDPLVKKYQDILMKTEKLILIFPIWWNEYPAIFKGFFERVCLSKFAFDYVPGGVQPKLIHIKSALIVTTSHAPTEVLKQRQGNMIERQVIHHMLEGIGINKNKWVNFGGVMEAGKEKQAEFIRSLKQEIVMI